MDSAPNQTLAVLIDAENAQPSAIQDVLAEISRYGTANVRRAYGDWTTPHMNGWKDLLHRLAIQPRHQFTYTKGKNATDAALIIDAMDLLHSGHLDGVCLVSSDSDFTPLATRLREAGLVVYGFGEKKTAHPFVTACDKFIYTEILRNAPIPAPEDEQAPAPLEPLLRDAIEATARDDGWANLGAVGSNVAKADPSFDSRNYGFAKLGTLVAEQPYLETRQIEHGSHPYLEVRVKTATGRTRARGCAYLPHRQLFSSSPMNCSCAASRSGSASPKASATASSRASAACFISGCGKR